MINKDTALTHQLSNAMAFLHCEILGRNNSREFLRQPQHKITYVFDTDVIVAFATPFAIGPAPVSGEIQQRNGVLQRRGYGQLLPRYPADMSENMLRIRAEENGVAWRTTGLLTEKSFQTAFDECGAIYQFPQHLEQTNIIRRKVEKDYLEIRKSTTGAPKSKTNAELRFHRNTLALSKVLLSENRSTEELIGFLSRRLETSFLEYYDGRSGIEMEYKNFNDFENLYGSVKPFREKLLSRDISSNYQFNKDFLEAEEVALKILNELWFRRLRRTSPWKNSENIEDDVNALVELTRVNRRLIYIRGDQPERVVFVTGDRSLIEATYGISRWEIERYVNAFVNGRITEQEFTLHDAQECSRKLREYFGIHLEESPSTSIRGWFENFSYHYVRHFWALAGEALIDPNSSTFRADGKDASDQNTKGKEQALQDFFHGYFAIVGERLSLSRKNMEKRVLRKKPHPSSLKLDVNVKMFLDEWKRLTRDRIESRRLADLDRKEFSDTLKNQNNKDNLLEVFEELAERQRDRAMVDISDYGAALLFQASENISMPPDLYFKTLNRTNNIIHNLADPSHYKDNATLFLGDLNEMSLDCFSSEHPESEKDDRQLSYLKFLVLGATFASCEKWAAAQGHAIRALNIIDRSQGEYGNFNGPIPVKSTENPDERSHISGREAYYLAAICTRMRAEAYTDFDNCEWFISKTEAALGQDKNARESLNEEFHSTRLLNERWSISLARYFYTRSRNEKADCSSMVESLSKFASDTKLKKLVETHLNDTRKAMYRLTCDSICFNYLQTFVILSFWNHEVIGDLMDATHRALTWLHRRSQLTERYSEPDLVRFYRLATPMGYFKDFPKYDSVELIKEQREKLLVGTESGLASPKNTVRSKYDLWRINMLGQYALGKL